MPGTTRTEVFNNAFSQADGAATSLATSNSLTNTEDIKNQILDDSRNLLYSGLNSAMDEGDRFLSVGISVDQNKSLGNITDQLASANNNVSSGAKDTYTRQAEINEWQAQNKLDTLFFLQIMFLFLTFLVIILFLRRSGVVSSTMFYLVTGVAFLIVIGTVWNRTSYTNNSRDRRYWNRRFIGLDDAAAGLSVKMKCD